MRRPVLFFTALALVAGGLVLFVSPARSDTHSDKALAEAVARGKTLYTTPFVAGAKTCASCHGPGPNKMTAARAKAFPRWDKAAQKVIGLQQKINQMIAAKSGGQALELGSDDLTAIEAYLVTLR
jgi:cytochrome c